MIDPKSLRDIDFLSDLNDQELGVLSGVLKEKEYPIGATVFTEGENGQSLYIIKKGEVKACKTTPEGDLLTLMLHKDGNISGRWRFLTVSRGQLLLLPLLIPRPISSTRMRLTH